MLRSKRKICAAVRVSAAIGGALISTHAALGLTWDSNGTSPVTPLDGAGTWDLSHADWSNGTTDQIWPNTSTSIATFGDGNGAAGVVHLSGSITAGGLVFNAAGSGNYNLSGSLLVLSQGTIQLANANPILSVSLDNGTGLTLSGTGSLTLAANNDYSGTTTVNGATLIVASSLALAGSDLVVNAAGSVAFNSPSTVTNIKNLGAITIASATTFTSSNPPYSFQQAGGTLTVNSTLGLNGGIFNYSGGSVVGTVTLNGSGPRLYLPTGTASGTFLFTTSGTIQTAIPTGATVQVQPVSTGSTYLEGSSGTVVNNGTLQMNSANGGYTSLFSNLVNSGLFSMSSTGTPSQASAVDNFTNNAGATAVLNTSTIVENLTNTGSLTIGAGATVTTTSSQYSFQQAGGTLTINGTLGTDGVPFNYSGGTIIGTVTINGSSGKLYLPTSAASGTFLLTASSDLIQTAIPSGVTVLYQPASSGDLEGQGTVTNNGTLQMASPNGGSMFIASNLTNSGSFMISANGTPSQTPYADTFTNTPNATATINTPFSLYGNMLNSGTLNLNAPLTFMSTSNAFNQSSGTTAIGQRTVLYASAVGQFIISGGTVSIASGTGTAGILSIASLLWPNPVSPVNPATDLAFITTQPYTSPQTPGLINLNGVQATFNIADPNATLTITAELENGQITKAGNGTLVLGGRQDITSPFNVNAGAVTLNPDLTLTNNPGITLSSGATLNVLASIPNITITNNNGTVNFPTPNTPGIHIVAISQLALSSGMQSTVANPSLHANRTLLELTTLSFSGATNAWRGRLDLSGNDMDVAAGTGTSVASITNQIAEGFNGGLWTGIGGIISSAAAGDSSHLTALGVIQNNQNGLPIYMGGSTPDLFDSIAPGAADILVKYTYYGDGNLDGKVDGSDYSLIDNGFVGHATGWLNGDFNYDGSVNGSDYTLIDNAFNAQSTSLATAVAQPTAQTASVPEPATLLFGTVAAIAILSRRRTSAFWHDTLRCRAAM